MTFNQKVQQELHKFENSNKNIKIQHLVASNGNIKIQIVGKSTDDLKVEHLISLRDALRSQGVDAAIRLARPPTRDGGLWISDPCIWANQALQSSRSENIEELKKRLAILEAEESQSDSSEELPY